MHKSAIFQRVCGCVCRFLISIFLAFTGIYDQSASAELLLAQPLLYAVGREAQLYRSHSFWVNIIDALYQSTVIFFIAYCVSPPEAKMQWLSTRIYFDSTSSSFFCSSFFRLMVTRLRICGNLAHWWRHHVFLSCWSTLHPNSDLGLGNIKWSRKHT